MTQLIKPKGLIKPILAGADKEEGKPIPTDAEGVGKYIDTLPKPVGYRMLVRPWSGKKKTKGGILLSDTTHETIQMTTVVGLVIRMGDLCYKDKEKFPTGPW